MKLSDHQYEFAKDVCKLFQYLIDKDIKFTLGEAWRHDIMQQYYYEVGMSKIKTKGYHGKRLAIDLNFFIDGTYFGLLIHENKMTISQVKKRLQHVGDYWESLNPLNQWGGNWKSFIDIPHFQRTVK